VVPGLVSPAQTPRPATTPFRSAPGPRPSGGRGQTAPLPPILEGRVGDVPSTSSGRGGIPSPFHVPATSCLSRSSLLHSIARGEQPPDRFRGGSSYQEGGHRRGSSAPSTSRLHQQHILGAEEEWEDAPSHQPQEAECSPFRDPTLQDGVFPGCASSHPSWGLGGLHRSEGRLLPRLHRYGGQEVPPLWLERTPIPILRPPLRLVTRWVP
jgi:hypothetical protein